MNRKQLLKNLKYHMQDIDRVNKNIDKLQENLKQHRDDAYKSMLALLEYDKNNGVSYTDSLKDIDNIRSWEDK